LGAFDAKFQDGRQGVAGDAQDRESFLLSNPSHAGDSSDSGTPSLSTVWRDTHFRIIDAFAAFDFEVRDRVAITSDRIGDPVVTAFGGPLIVLFSGTSDYAPLIWEHDDRFHGFNGLDAPCP
jgi:hypothetical protein